MTITSTHNQQLKEIRKLRSRRRTRERAARFVAEGEDLLAAADAAGWTALARYCAAGSGLPGTPVQAQTLAAASGLASSTRALGVYAERWAPAPLGPVCVYLHGVHDPGNVGTILRAGHAFGAGSVALGPGSADPFGPKAVRASMGAIFAVPVVRVAQVAQLPGVKIALVPGRGRPLREVCRLGTEGPYSDDNVHCSLIVGSERDGLPDEIKAQADHVAHIPTTIHSLNAAMAATVALYELTSGVHRSAPSIRSTSFDQESAR